MRFLELGAFFLPRPSGRAFFFVTRGSNTHTPSIPTSFLFSSVKMARKYTVRCKRGSGKQFHKPSGTCRTPCKKSHGASFRRSPKAPYYKCIQTKRSRRRASK